MHELEKKLRALLNASFVADGINPHQINKVLAKDAPTARAYNTLYNKRVYVGTAPTVAADVRQAARPHRGGERRG